MFLQCCDSLYSSVWAKLIAWVGDTELTSEASGVAALLEQVEATRDREDGEPEDGGLEDSAASPFGRTPSANQTLLWSRDREPKQETNTKRMKYKSE